MRFFGCYLAMLLLAAARLPATITIPVPTEPESGVTIEIESWLDTCPKDGMMPIELKITNGSARGQEWTLTARDGYGSGTNSTFHLAVGPGRSASARFYATVTPNGSTYRSLNLALQGSGVLWNYSLSAPPHPGGSGGSKNMGFLAMSKNLSDKGWSELSDRFDKTSGGPRLFEASKVDMTKAPDDWRGYAGLAQLWMSDSEWLALGAGVRTAITDWMALGGRTVLFCTNTTAARLAELKLPELDADNGRSVGAGGFKIQSWDGKTFPVNEAERLAFEVNDENGATTRGSYSHWTLRDEVGVPRLHSGLIFTFILVFGVLVGPVNLFWLAGARRRHRLFWTTPLLSLAASALLIALMFLQDGIGGNGARRVLALMIPEQKTNAITTAIIQEQACRTGVLLGRTFTKAEPSWMQPVSMEDTTVFNPMANAPRQFNEDEQRRSGDWFASRAVQGHALATVRHDRGVIEVSAPADESGAPSFKSNVNAPLQFIFVVDEKNRVWKAKENSAAKNATSGKPEANIGTGKLETMVPCDRKEFTDWMENRVISDAGPIMRQTLDLVRNRRGFVFAECADASKFAISTLDSIRWNDERVIFAGPYLLKHTSP